MDFIEIKGADRLIKMSKIVLGTDFFGVNIPEKDAFDLMDRYAALGGNTLDTARIYGKDPTAPVRQDAYSNSEPIVGRWLRERGCRDKFTVVTKGGHYDMDNRTPRVSRSCVDADLKKSLEELGLDNVDVYFLHRDDPETPVGEIMDFLHEFVKAGKVRALGASNWSVKRITEANDYARSHGKTPFAVSQIQWCAAQVDPSVWKDSTIVVMNKEEYEGYWKLGIPVMSFSVQARGYFSKLLDGMLTPEASAMKYDSSENRRRGAAMEALCKKTGASPAALMLAYVVCDPLPGAAVVGCSQVKQLEDSMAAADLGLAPEDFSFAAFGPGAGC